MKKRVKNKKEESGINSKKKNWKVLILCLIVVYLTAFIGSIFTSAGTGSDWYKSTKPSITPPNWVFPVVWNVLFFLIALSLYLSLVHSNRNYRKKIAVVFGINFILNILWSFFYFKMENPFYAFIDLIFLEISIILMMTVTFKVSKKSGYLLIPYLIWVAFAGILNWLSI